MKNELKRVLIIDDDPDICEVSQIILTRAGYHATSMDHFEPFNGKDLPDIILLDISLPKQDGRKICRQLKDNKVTQHIPIILFSASHDTAKAAKESGADDSIEKPFQLNDLVEKVRNLHTNPQNGEKVTHQG